MPLFVLLILIVVFFVIGVSFLYKGFTTTPDIGTKEIDGLKENLETAEQSAQQAQSELTAAQASLGEAKKMEKQLTALKATEEVNAQKLKELDRNLKEVHSFADKQAQESLEVIETLQNQQATSEELESFKNTADQQAKDSLEAIETLTKENENLKAEQSENEKIAQEIDALKGENQDLKNKLEELEQKQAEVANQGKDAEKLRELGDHQAEEAVEVIETLKKDNEALAAEKQALAAQIQENESKRKELEEKLTKLSEGPSSGASVDNETVSRLQNENETLQSQVNDGLSKIQQLQQQLQSASTGQQSPDAPQQEEEFKNLYAEFKTQIEEMKGTVDQLKTGGASGGQGGVDPQLAEKIEKLKELNNFLIDKEKVMQKELTRSKVETLGLKKICEDFKVQLDRQSKKS